MSDFNFKDFIKDVKFDYKSTPLKRKCFNGLQIILFCLVAFFWIKVAIIITFVGSVYQCIQLNKKDRNDMHYPFWFWLMPLTHIILIIGIFVIIFGSLCNFNLNFKNWLDDK